MLSAELDNTLRDLLNSSYPTKAEFINFFLIQYLSRGIQFSRASLNGALTKHENKDFKTLKFATFMTKCESAQIIFLPLTLLLLVFY